MEEHSYIMPYIANHGFDKQTHAYACVHDIIDVMPWKGAVPPLDMDRLQILKENAAVHFDDNNEVDEGVAIGEIIYRYVADLSNGEL